MPVASRVPQTPGRSRSPVSGGTKGRRAGGDHDVRCGVPDTVDLDDTGAGQPAVAPQQVDVVLGEPALLAGVGIVRHHEVPPRQRGLDVDLCAGAGLARTVHRLARAQQRLGRNARPVGALTADQLPFDDGDVQSAGGQRRSAVLTGGAAAEHDHVIVRIGVARVDMAAPVLVRRFRPDDARRTVPVAPGDPGSSPWSGSGPGVHQ